MKTHQLISFLLTAMLISACGKDQPKSPGTGQANMPPPEVSVITVATGSATLTQDLPGRLQAIRSAQVRARVEGILEKRLYKEGSDITAGTPLFHIEPRTYQAAAAAADAELAAAKATFERYKPLLETRAVSQQEYDGALARYKQAEATLARARLDLENAVPRAPISGRAGRALVTEGALVGKGEATHLMTIEQLDPVRVEFTRNYSDVLRLQQAVKAGTEKQSDSAEVQLVLEDGTLYPEKGQVQFADMAVEPSSGAVVLRAHFPNPRHELLPGTFVRVRFPQAELDKAIRIPQRAVQGGPGGQAVMSVNAEGKVQPLPVKTGAMIGADFIVTSGLKGGETIIIDGLQKAPPGTPVKTVPWHPDTPILQAPAAAPTEEKK